VIYFPAGAVSRLRPNGVRDGRWNSGFLRFTQRAGAPILPVCIKARNSSLFYGTSMLYKPLSALLLVQEMFLQRARTAPRRYRRSAAGPCLTPPPASTAPRPWRWPTATWGRTWGLGGGEAVFRVPVVAMKEVKGMEKAHG